MKPVKALTLLIILTLAVSMTLVTSFVCAATTPSVPQFTVQYVDRSYDVPPAYRTDPYTGETTLVNPGYRASNRTIDVIIVNQPFTPYKNAENQTVELFYDIRVKGHYEDWGGEDSYGTHNARSVKPSSSSHTVVTFLIDYWGIGKKAEIDFQVKAVTRYSYGSYVGCGIEYETVLVSDSGWSNTVTLRIDEDTVTSTPTVPPYTFPPMTPYPKMDPTSPPTTSPIEPDSQKGVLGFLYSLDWKQTALILMAIIITVLVVSIIVAIWRRGTPK